MVEELGFDACVDYKADDFPNALKAACPGGINVYFDNVGGDILNAVLGNLAHRARVVMCGIITTYLNGDHPVHPPT